MRHSDGVGDLAQESERPPDSPLGPFARLLRPFAVAREDRRARRGRPGPEIVTRIRDRDYSRWSDLELRDSLGGLRGGEADDERLMTLAYAIVDQAVRRRLGAWRLFNPDFQRPALRRYRDLSVGALTAGRYRSQVGYYTDDAFLEGPAFARGVHAGLAPSGLDDDDRTIITAMVYVAEKSRHTHESEILLPARFYQALSAKGLDEVLAFRPTDEQMLAGCLLYRGKVVEMSAGEGKTLAAAFPAVLHSLLGRAVHVITANDYLAGRDAELLAPVYESLGMSVSAVLGHMGDADRAQAYDANVVYATVRELGFDFLRDNLRRSADELIQGPLDVAIVDEADMALIDDAATPLIISGGSRSRVRAIHNVKKAVGRLVEAQRDVILDLQAVVRDSKRNNAKRRKALTSLYLADPHSDTLAAEAARDRRLYRRLRAAAADGGSNGTEPELSRHLFYTVDADNEVVTLTDIGQASLEQALGPVFATADLERRLAMVESSGDVPVEERRRIIRDLQGRLARRYGQMDRVYKMLHAVLVLRRDVDYVVTDGRVVLVDGPTGRRRPDTRYQRGLHEAIEAIEGLPVNTEPEALAQISVRGFVKQYATVSGMTGTAVAAADELRRVYGLDVVAVSPSRPSRRVDIPTRLYPTRRAKLAAVLDEVRLCQTVGRPVLVGTLTVDQSEEISRLLTRNGVEHSVLNAVTTSDEERIVRSAGRSGAVTVATNMAGRGTDILLDPDLDPRVTDGYVTHVRDLLSMGTGRVALVCADARDSDLLQSALSSGGMSVVTTRRSGRAVVSARLFSPSTSTERGPGGEVSLAFGLGLHVVGTELNDSRRADLQLRGRSGRQGESGSSEFILSLEDRPLMRHAGSVEGRAYAHGARVERWVRAVQAETELGGETARALVSGYDRIVESQSLWYYRVRREVMAMDSFDALCRDLARSHGRRIVDRLIPAGAIGQYADRFDELAEEVWLDYRIDAGGLWGLGPEALSGAVGALLEAKLRELAARYDRATFQETSVRLFLRTADELWALHLRRLQDLVLSTNATGRGVSEFALHGAATCRDLVDEVIETFLFRLLALPAPTEEEHGAADKPIVRDLEEILV